MNSNNILIDFHGVLTDGKQTISHDGSYMFDHVHVRDIRAIREFLARGFYVAIVTASSSPIIASFAQKVGADHFIARDKRAVLSKPLFIDNDFIAIGDDAWDVSMLDAAKRAFCPLDADESVLRLEGIEVLNTLGGKGCIAEMLAKICTETRP